MSLAERADDEYMSDIHEENEILKRNLEEVLNLLRIEEFSKDFAAQQVELKELVNQALDEKRREIRYSHIQFVVDINDKYKVLTDKKWAQYMLEQIISNAIKYSVLEKSESILIKASKDENKVILSVIDNGIGISEKDIHRVFDPFFTGVAGRQDRRATGIGLYMVKLISERLGHRVQI